MTQETFRNVCFLRAGVVDILRQPAAPHRDPRLGLRLYGEGSAARLLVPDEQHGAGPE